MSVLRIVGLIGGNPTPFDGQYVLEYDPGQDSISPDGRWMRCLLRTTPDRAEALDRPRAEMLELWRSVDPREPTRPDGRKNRPLTAFTAELS